MTTTLSDRARQYSLRADHVPHTPAGMYIFVRYGSPQRTTLGLRVTVDAVIGDLSLYSLCEKLSEMGDRNLDR